MKAVTHVFPKGLDGLKVQEMPEIEPGKGEVRITLKSAGLNHRDLRVQQRDHSPEEPLILGSDGAGIIEKLGEGTTQLTVGQEVIINPSLGWPHKSDAPPDTFDILGVPTAGTFAEKIVVPAANIEPKPAYLSWEEASVLPIAALTGYRALFTRGRLQPGEHVLIVGIGSGVATFMLLMAKAAGARVTVTSRDEVKRQRALDMGADQAIDSSRDWNEQMNGEKAHLIIDSVGPATFPQSLAQLRPGGRLVNFGETSGPEVIIPLRPFFFGQFELIGTTLGCAEEFKETIQFMENHQIHPIVDRVYPLEEAASALKRIQDGEQYGNIALRMD
ncbi:zinc-binding alcohol dehydrogenase/oxidoreductase [Marininema mesophilum]|uniref:Zinc-binding alcohol dehydrogenase/oxidoreductase n=1 Tax=Marininema mesophilum TaxID=1048340 RepID=A0A1H2ZMI8_9BACL|nr:zinc-binding dehydrogenase [Marininema mesophilum]SDX18630.1 zinc-binding alcohol dehydrogenase/oxidoreductase [Marininema mesophilum]